MSFKGERSRIWQGNSIIEGDINGKLSTAEIKRKVDHMTVNKATIIYRLETKYVRLSQVP